MTDLYIIRHCEAVGNKFQIFQGISDCDITECGAGQLEYLAERFKNIPLDLIYSGPLKRAVFTAEAINKYHGLKIKINSALTEIDGGEIEGKSLAEISEKYPLLEYAWNMKPHTFYPLNGESMQEVYIRSGKFIKQVLNKNKGKTIALVSHGCTIRNIICNILGKPVNELIDINWLDNTGICHFRLNEKNTPETILFNDTSHLPEKFLPSESKIKNVVCQKPEDDIL